MDIESPIYLSKIQIILPCGRRLKELEEIDPQFAWPLCEKGEIKDLGVTIENKEEEEDDEWALDRSPIFTRLSPPNTGNKTRDLFDLDTESFIPPLVLPPPMICTSPLYWSLLEESSSRKDFSQSSCLLLVAIQKAFITPI